MKVLFYFTSPASQSGHADLLEATYLYSALHCLWAFEHLLPVLGPMISTPVPPHSLFFNLPQDPWTFRTTIYWIKLNLTLSLDIMPYNPVPLWVRSGFWGFSECPPHISVTTVNMLPLISLFTSLFSLYIHRGQGPCCICPCSFHTQHRTWWVSECC